jgi:hypothetical protein
MASRKIGESWLNNRLAAGGVAAYRRACAIRYNEENQPGVKCMQQWRQ